MGTVPALDEREMVLSKGAIPTRVVVQRSSISRVEIPMKQLATHHSFTSISLYSNSPQWHVTRSLLQPCWV